MNTTLTAEERVQRAKKAAEARWKGIFDWESAPLDDARLI